MALASTIVNRIRAGLEELVNTLKARVENNLNRHKGFEWAKVQTRLEANTEKLWSLHEMEKTGGEPDVTGRGKKTGEYVFCNCSAELSFVIAATTLCLCITTARSLTMPPGGSAVC